ncbi:response regulator receiver modulated diguanylate cyclase [Methylobacterium sp. 4-46]|uniref:GGDEF domain-containing protein n=1 Tax=unclassified Methylobacterium TaxID=2615210 RepID=UPI000152D15E|nr:MULTISPECIES: diguanylate cyclase [Methylobacterium]ACA19370.1 response regulator receiver modulated diguanylate cyclase [Methylobacterium sp. 4-46]WFT78569.1 diguanylate cyclase [Methylobacterium nodulans]
MHIVVVDPSRVVLKVIGGLLDPRGHTVNTFTDSREALDYVTANEAVTALITSLEVRPLTGLELCWSARLLAEAHRPLYIIAMSSARNARNLAEVLDSGADDFIDKPPGGEELYARLRAAERVTRMQRELIRLAETDSLTELLNRRAFVQRVAEIAGRAGNHGKLALVVADIDNFKRINDEHGHALGDVAIQGVATALSEVPDSLVGRLGGEEFGVALPGRSLEEAEAIANRLRLRCTQLRFKGRHGPVQLSCSFGVSAWSEGETIEGLHKRADIALYEAKATGRNRVVSAFTDLVLARAG